jgi:hypothetical protein
MNHKRRPTHNITSTIAALLTSASLATTFAQDTPATNPHNHVPSTSQNSFQPLPADSLFPDDPDNSPFLPAAFHNTGNATESAVTESDLQSEMEFNRPLPSLTAPPQPQPHPRRRTSADCCGEEPLSRFRKGCFQGAAVSAAYIHDNPDSGLAVTSTDVSASLAIPLGSFDNVIVATPFLRTDFLNAATALDLPDEVHETGARFFWRRPATDNLSLMAIVTPAVRTDFRNTDNAFRIFGLGLLIWQAVPDTLSLSGGVVHTGRDDFPVLPAVGLLWTPAPEWKVDIQFPSPRISRRLDKDGPNSETWAYLAGAFGGNTWSVERPSGINDQLTLRDYRLITGIEHLLPENRSIFLEGGLIFGRAVEFESSPDTTEPDSTGIIRCGIAF